MTKLITRKKSSRIDIFYWLKDVWESTIMITWFLLASLSVNFCFTHCKKYRNFTQFPGVEILWKGAVSTQFLHQKIRWNYGILRSDQVYEFIKIKKQYADIKDFSYWTNLCEISKSTKAYLNLSRSDTRDIFKKFFYSSSSDESMSSNCLKNVKQLLTLMTRILILT